GARPGVDARIVTSGRAAQLQAEALGLNVQPARVALDADRTGFDLVTGNAPRRVQPTGHPRVLQVDGGFVLDFRRMDGSAPGFDRPHRAEPAVQRVQQVARGINDHPALGPLPRVDPTFLGAEDLAEVAGRLEPSERAQGMFAEQPPDLL